MNIKNAIRIRNLIFLICAGLVQHSIGQNTGPTAPDYMAFEPVDAKDMVNLLTGDFTYSLPIIQLPGPNGGYSMGLSYHSGIGVDQEASWVGLGWSLSPGSINRSVIGTPDDRKGQAEVTVRELEDSKSYLFASNKSKGLYLGANISQSQSYASMQSSNGINANGNYGISVGKGVSQGDNGSGSFNPSYGQDGGVSSFMSNNGTITVSKNYSNGDGGTGIQSSHSGFDGFKVFNEESLYKLFNFNLKYGALYTNDAYEHNLTQKSVVPFASPSGTSAITDSYEQGKHFSMDAYSLPFNEATFENPSWNANNNLMEFMAMDNYEVLSQGFTGNIEPKMGEFGLIVNPHLDVSDDAKETYGFYKYPFSNAQDDIYFAAKNANQGYLNVNSAYLFGQHGDPVINSVKANLTSNGWELEQDPWTRYTQGSESGSGYNLAQNTTNKHPRLYGSNFVEYFTNRELANNVVKDGYTLQQRGFLEATGITTTDRNNVELFSPDGIGAYAVTTPTGVTYHYSLPVYSGKEVSHTTVYDDDVISTQKGRSIHADHSKYATTWLLTGVTGHDYVDVNNDGLLDESDYGYWVSFEYGKFSDEYIWRAPYIGEDKNGYEKSFGYGAKELYYLDQIKTKTHTALFIKEPREDALGAKKSEMTFSDMQHWTGDLTLDDGFTIQPYSNIGVYSGSTSDIAYQTFITDNLDVSYRKRILDRIAGNSDASSSVSLYSHVTDDVPVSVFLDNSRIHQKHVTLALKHIYLFRNEDLPTFSKTAGGTYSGTVVETVSNLDVHTRVWAEHQLNTVYTGVGPTQTSRFYPVSQDEYNSSATVQMLDEVLDIDDLSTSDLDNFKSKALKIIDFNYGYEIGTMTQNSNTGKKLTLKSLAVKGRNGVETSPRYEFGYVDNITNPTNLTSTLTSDLMKVYDQSSQFPSERELETDNWGYQKNFTSSGVEGSASGSLNRILTPTGAVINIDYESDEYTSEYAYEDVFYDVTTMKSGSGMTLNVRLNKALAHNINVGEAVDLDLYLIKDDPSKFHPTTGFIDEATVNYVSTVNDNLSWLRLSTHIQGVISSISADGTIISLNVNLSDDDKYTELKQYFFESNRTDWFKKDFPSWRVKMTLPSFSNTQVFRAGGERVASIEITDDITSYKTVYDYNLPLTSLTSGVTSYTPFSEGRVYVPYRSELPAPKVIYSHVSVQEMGDDNTSDLGKVTYEFNVPRHSSNESWVGYSIPGFFAVTTEEGKPSSSVPNPSYANDGHTYEVANNSQEPGINFKSRRNRYNIIENSFSSLGVLKNKSVRNFNNDIVEDTKYEYYSEDEIDAFASPYSGSQKTSSGTVRVFDQEDYRKVFYTTNSKKSYGNLLKKVDYFKDGLKYSAEYKDYNPITGSATTLFAESSFGDRFKSVSKLGYEQYYDLGLKNHSFDNKNILGTEIENLVYLEDGTDESLIEASAITWENDWMYREYYTEGSVSGLSYYKNLYTLPGESPHKVWRQQANYKWRSKLNDDGLIKDTDGVFSDSDRFKFNADGGAGSGNNIHWEKVSENTLFNHNSELIESWNLDGNYTSRQFNNNQTKVLSATQNGKRNESLFSGVEPYENVSSSSEVQKGTASISTTEAHTGGQSLYLEAGRTAFNTKLFVETISVSGANLDASYVVSFWTKKPSSVEITFSGKNASNASIFTKAYTETSIEPFEVLDRFGDWYLVQKVLPKANAISGGSSSKFLDVYLRGIGASTYVDDFRIHPSFGSMSSYVYDDQGRIWFMLNADNIGTKYEYDAQGNLKSIYTEEVGSNGGFKKRSETTYHYQRD